MKTIVTITGHKYTKKDFVAKRLGSKKNAQFIYPYCETELPPSAIAMGNGLSEILMLNYVLPSELDEMIERENVLSVTVINGKRYVFFEFQMTADYNVLIADDYAVNDIMSNWVGNIVTIRLESAKEEESDRVGEYFFKEEFDVLFNVDGDDFAKLEVLVDG